MSALMKLVGTVLVITSCSAMGAGMAARLSERLALLKRIRVLVIHLKGEILYANVPLAEGFDRTGKRAGKAEGELFRRVSERLMKGSGESFFDIWKDEAHGFLETSPLTEREGEQLISFGEHLGYLDREMQERTILLYLEELEEEIEGISREIAQKRRLYTSAGIMAGLFLAVILV